MTKLVHYFLLCLENKQLERIALLTTLGIAALARIAFALLFPDQTSVLPDVIAYRAAADDILAGRLIANNYVMPGYPLFIALLHSTKAQLSGNIALSVASVWCVWLIALKISGESLCALIAAFFWSIYPFSLFYATTGLTETLFVTLVLLSFAAFYCDSFFLGSVAMTAAILTRPAVEILTPLLIVIFTLIVHRCGWKKTLQHLGIFAAVYVAMMSPWWWHNYEKYKQFVRLNLASGIVLYSGNNSMNKTGGGIGGIDFDTSKFVHIGDPIALDRSLRQAAVQFISENPRETIRLMGLKIMRLWRPWPYATEYNKPYIIIAVAATSIPLYILALAGLLTNFLRRWRALTPVIIFISFITAIHVITIASIRYRFPIEPFLVILAAIAIATTIQRIASAGVANKGAWRYKRASA